MSFRVLQDWVFDLPARAQGTLLTGVRGCDVAPKKPITSADQHTPERQLVAYLRFLTLNPADPREVDVPGAWFQSSPGEFRASEFGHYPLHWYAHLMHCYEIVAYAHPSQDARFVAWSVYSKLVEGLHLKPETRAEMFDRLTEDRVRAGTVVS